MYILRGALIEDAATTTTSANGSKQQEGKSRQSTSMVKNVLGWDAEAPAGQLPIFSTPPRRAKYRSSEERDQDACLYRAAGYEEVEEATFAQFGRVVVVNPEIHLNTCDNYITISASQGKGLLYLEHLSRGDLPKTWCYIFQYSLTALYTVPNGFALSSITFTSVNDFHSDIVSDIVKVEHLSYTRLPPLPREDRKAANWYEGCSPQDITIAVAPDWVQRLIAKQ